MSQDTLAPADLDRLLRGGARFTPRSAAALELQPYDFRRPQRVGRDRMRTLEALYERLVKALEGWLGTRVRGAIEARLQSVEQFTFREFALSLPVPCASFLFDVAETGQQGVVEVGPEIANYLIERLFGGEGQASQPITRSLTPIERMAIRPVAERTVQLLQEAWQDQLTLTLQVSGFESSPEMLQPVPHDEPVLVATIELTMTGGSSVLMVCLPIAAMESFLSGDSRARQAGPGTSDAEREKARQQSESALRVTRIPLEARLPEFPVRLRDLSALTVGSILPTGLPTDARIIVRTGTQDRFIGHAGRVSGHLAVRIVDAVPTATPVALPAPDSRTPTP